MIQQNLANDILYGAEDIVFHIGKELKVRGDTRRRMEIQSLSQRLERLRVEEPTSAKIDSLLEEVRDTRRRLGDLTRMLSVEYLNAGLNMEIVAFRKRRRVRIQERIAKLQAELGTNMCSSTIAPARAET